VDRISHEPAGDGTVPLYLFSFVSGVAALVYQVCWARMLSLTFGSATLAVSAVVAGFMGGMGLGAALYHRAEGRVATPLRLYLVLELGIALSAAALTACLWALPEPFARAVALLPGGLVASTATAGAILVLLAIPAALMGATFPALCRTLISSRPAFDRHLGPIYGLNTLGAALGALLAGLFLIERLGITASVLVGNLLNLSIVGAGLVVARRFPAVAAAGAAPPPPAAAAAIPTDLPFRITAVVLVVSGFTTLSYEIAWFRAIRSLVGTSTHALSIVLAVFLTGLGAGSLLLRRVLSRPSPERDLAVVQFAIALLASLPLLIETALLAKPELAALVSVYYGDFYHLEWGQRLVLHGTLAFVMMFPATLCMGLSFPLASRLYLGDVRRLGARIGRAYLLANVGSIAGALGTALVLLPWLGTIGTTRFSAALNLGLGLLVLAALRSRRRTRLAWGAAAAAAVLLLGAMLPKRLPFDGEALWSIPARLLFDRESDLGTVHVWQSVERPALRGIAIDGTIIGASPGWNYDVYSKQVLLAHLPMVLDTRVRSALTVGLGSASTVDALATYPSLERIDCVEIDREVIRGSRFFPQSEALVDPRVRVLAEDASTYLLRTDVLYDTIVSDGKQNVYHPMNALLLSAEFYQRALDRLTPSGTFVQWVNLATLAEDFEITLRTFAQVFPEMEIFVDPPRSVIMVGSREPLAGRPRLPEAKAARLRVQGDLRRLAIVSPDALAGRHVAGRRALDELVGPGPINTWDRSILEFSAYRAAAEDWASAEVANLELLIAARDRDRSELRNELAPPGSGRSRSIDLVLRAMRSAAQGDMERAEALAREATEADPSDLTARHMLRRYQVAGGSSPGAPAPSPQEPDSAG
jgi:spermidine synthase